MRTGLREVALHDWVFSVNGERLFLKGVNLAPTRQALAEATPARACAATSSSPATPGSTSSACNGHITRPELYDAADELGMLVWQDFPLQWGYARTVRKQAVRQAGRRWTCSATTRPSRCGARTTSRCPSTSSRQKACGPSIVRHVLSQQVPSWNKTILDRWVKRAFETADETRPVVAHSGVAPHFPQLDGTDSHLYFGWYHGDERDLEGFAATVPRMVRFVSEFGAQSVPDRRRVHGARALAGPRLGPAGRHHGMQTRGVRAARAAAPVRHVRRVARRHPAATRPTCCATTSSRCAG